MSASLVPRALLVRADSGFCSSKQMQEVTAKVSSLKRDIVSIIKWNLRRAPVETIAAGKLADTAHRGWLIALTNVNAIGKRAWNWLVSASMPTPGPARLTSGLAHHRQARSGLAVARVRA